MSLDRSKPIDFGSFSDTAFLGNPSSTMDRQTASAENSTKGGNIAGSDSYVAPPVLRIAPSFQGASGQGDNQSTSRPKGAV